ncbi:PTS lactose transporter subunit IIC [Bacillus cereus]|uniref:PTS sugar transporter subunit IIC n=1 Tax=Bacillus cereus TaxID=1396 RepID=UPI00065D92F0|nr:PTS sugar transporter subunit IIC [Bacillus cereus]KMN69819.1 PTS lactose transporter subunit IIC [Bacillus cereus]
MQKFIKFMEKYIVPTAEKIGKQRHLTAIRDGFMIVMPLVLVGAIALLINNLPIDSFQNLMKSIFGDTWKEIGNGIWTGSFATLSLMVAIGISYMLAKSYDLDAISAAIITFGALIIISPTTPKEGGIDLAWTGAQGLFVSIIIALVVTEIFRFFVQRDLTIKMPDGVPPAVMNSFAALVPALVILSITAGIQLTVKLAGTSIHKIVFEGIQLPLQGLAGTLPSAIVIASLIHVLWFFGINAPNIIGGIMDPIYLPALEKNMKLFNNGVSAYDVPNIITAPFFEVYVYIGGSGATLSFLVAVLLVAKSAQLRGVGRVSIIPGFFNINEPVIFGTPIVLNAALIIPFVLTPIVLVITSYTAISLGWVPKTVALVPWTMPPIISGYLVAGGNIAGAVLQIINFSIAVLIYYPFVLMCDSTYLHTSKTTNENCNSTISL